ncbi:MAG TPA: YidC/Oxa1 family membrane protein insertase [Candidatus Limnocylindria bacterium]|nr:YidC/Oxa1 family membrane protein insertase [Candidatus Limnocylindria bacterium]
MNLVLGAGFLGIEHFTPPWDVFFLPLFNLLIASYRIIFSDFALAIIVFTIVIRTLLAPLFVRQIQSQKEMQRMAPLIREVNRKHKGNRTKIAEETQALYREHGVNPAAGCLPVVLQLPLLFALYQALIRASNVVTLSVKDAASDTFTQLQAALPGIVKLQDVKDAAGQITQVQFAAPVAGPCNLPQFEVANFTHFLPLNCQLVDPLQLTEKINTHVSWLMNLDLAQIDNKFGFLIPGIGFTISALAILAAMLQFIQVRMTSPKPNPDDPTSSTTTTMTYLFPLLTIWWGGLFPSGLILYWVVYTAYLVVQQYRIMGWGNLFPLFGWQPGFAPAPEAGLVSRPARRDPPAPSGRDVASSNPRASGSPGGTSRPASRPTKKRRRGRKR